MIDNKSIAVIIKAYNEEKQIGMVIDSIPDWVDRVIVVNDGSQDDTSKIVESYIDNFRKDDNLFQIPNNFKPIVEETLYNKADIIFKRQREQEENYYPNSVIYNNSDTDKIVLINQENNGAGAAVLTGYKWARDHAIDCTVVVDGDGQMDPSEMYGLVSPILFENVDYTKGNRLAHPASKVVIPEIRYFGNNVLSLLTKISSGYWSVSDTQTGYTAISLRALSKLELYSIYYKYGYPNDILVKLNVADCIIKEIPIKPVYNVGEKSKMKVLKVIPSVSLLLLKDFIYRINNKYLINSFHPLFLLYWVGVLIGMIDLPILIKILVDVIVKNGSVTIGWYFTWLVFTLFSFQSICFGMWMDIQDNLRLYKKDEDSNKY